MKAGHDALVQDAAGWTNDRRTGPLEAAGALPGPCSQDGGPGLPIRGSPGGTQVPEDVIDAMAQYLRTSNANEGGAFPTSAETDMLIGEARRAGADLVSGAEPADIVFGPDMNTPSFALSRSLAHQLGLGEEVVVTVLDHDADVAPWVGTRSALRRRAPAES